MSREIRNRYINADLFKENINPVWYLDSEYCGVYDKKDIEDMIDAQPTADVAEVKHGHWTEDGYDCSVCGKWVDVLQGTAEMNYCPNCGAKMDEEVYDDR